MKSFQKVLLAYIPRRKVPVLVNMIAEDQAQLYSESASCKGPKLLKFTHTKARSPTYPFSKQKRFTVPDERVSWSVDFKEYKPYEYTSEVVMKNPPWADSDIRTSNCKYPFNATDGITNRKSHMGNYEVIEGIPQNPYGRTGLTGRGLLGKWGPNHAADPIVTRWKRHDKIVTHKVSKKPILQFIAIQRSDTKEWAIPGGMVNASEHVSLTLKREFSEEALNSLELPEKKKKELDRKIHDLFAKGTLIYKGYVDDHRNTDNAWMETVAMNFHDENGSGVGSLPLHAGDDAGAVQWMDVDSTLKLFASHTFFIKKVADLHCAHW